MATTRLRIAAGVLLTLAGLELLCRLLPVSTATLTGYHGDPELLTYPPGHRWVASTGWDLRNPQRLQANAQGFLADHDFVRDPDAVALIGDSYVEGSMLDADARAGAQLERLLPGRKVFAMGSPGTALLDYAQRIRWAHENYGVRDMVLLLERSDARQVRCGSGNVHSRCLDPATLESRVQRLPEPGPFKRLARHSALLQYLFGQVKLDGRHFLAEMLTRQAPAADVGARARVAPSAAALAAERRVIDAAVQEFFRVAKPHVAGRLVILVDGLRSPAGRPEGADEFQRAHLIDALRRGGADVVDLEPVYARHGAVSPLSLDVGPYDGHLNRLGLALAMKAGADALHTP
ncbi:MAG: hypothetical protein QM788_17275 [Roseateles sp.]|uniref:hypothetical protein n=1 Tax=Roseateles sp. TaxID=1971397 RepID=UPI0039E92F81